MAIIGKNVIENLTTAMYEDLRIIYREYIQNSADSIDKAVSFGLIRPEDARIEIEINPKERRMQVKDNGTGIFHADFERVMSSIADSTKDRAEDKGFRGIGRLGGISSCDILPESVKLRIEKSRKPCATMDCGKYTFYPMGEIPKSLKLLWHKGQSHFLKMSFSDSCILFSHKIFSAMPKVKRLFRI